MRLPIRLVPSRGKHLAIFLALLAAICYLLFSATQRDSDLWKFALPDDPKAALDFLPSALIFLGLILLAVGLYRQILMIQPNSPYYYFEIGVRGVVLRRGRKTWPFSWSQISPFAVGTWRYSTRRGWKTEHWIVALLGGEDVHHFDAETLWHRAVLQINPVEYGGAAGKSCAYKFADALNAIRDQSAGHPDDPHHEVQVPANFATAAAAATDLSPRPAPATPEPRSSVIER